MEYSTQPDNPSYIVDGLFSRTDVISVCVCVYVCWGGSKGRRRRRRRRKRSYACVRVCVLRSVCMYESVCAGVLKMCVCVCARLRMCVSVCLVCACACVCICESVQGHAAEDRSEDRRPCLIDL